MKLHRSLPLILPTNTPSPPMEQKKGPWHERKLYSPSKRLRSYQLCLPQVTRILGIHCLRRKRGCRKSYLCPILSLVSGLSMKAGGAFAAYVIQTAIAAYHLPDSRWAERVSYLIVLDRIYKPPGIDLRRFGGIHVRKDRVGAKRCWEQCKKGKTGLIHIAWWSGWILL